MEKRNWSTCSGSRRLTRLYIPSVDCATADAAPHQQNNPAHRMFVMIRKDLHKENKNKT